MSNHKIFEQRRRNDEPSNGVDYTGHSNISHDNIITMGFNLASNGAVIDENGVRRLAKKLGCVSKNKSKEQRLLDLWS